MKKLNQIPTTPKALANLREKLDAVTVKLLTPAPRLRLSDWCDAHRFLSPESSPEPGRWRTDRAPYQREILDVAGDHTTQRIVVMSSAQIGKTSMIENVIAVYMAYDPAPMLLVMPELVTAKAFSSDRLDPMVRDTPALKGVIKQKRSRDSGNTILQKRFIGGQLTMIGANAASGLRSRPIRVLLMDEVDAYPASAGGESGEGDPVNLAVARTTNFWNRKIILTSTPTIKGFSRIEKEFDLSDQRYYHVPCPHCNHFDKLTWKRIQWDDNNPDTAHLICLECGCVIEETEKLSMLRKGKWIAEAPGNTTAGFHINALYSPWATWPDLVRKFLESKGNPQTLQVFVNTVLGETWEEAGDRLESHHLAVRATNDKYDAEVPTGVGLLTAGVDVQSDRIEIAVWGFGEREESWWIDTQAVYLDPSTDLAWQHVESHLRRTYKHKSGALVPINAVAIDTGHQADVVGRFVSMCQKNHPRTNVRAVKGSSEPGRPIISRGNVGKVSKVVNWIVGTDTAKDLLFGRLKQKEVGPGYVHFPPTVSLETLEQITSEKVITKYRKGKPYREWVKIRPRNEQLDLMVYALAALVSLGTPVRTNLGVLASKLSGEIQAVEVPVEEPKEPQPIDITQKAINDRLRQFNRPRNMKWKTGWGI